MGLIVAILILAILILILVMLFEDERRSRTSKASTGEVTGYWDGSERRASVRVPAHFKTRYCVDHRSLSFMENSRTKNISLGGILMQLYEKINPQTILVLDIFLPDEKTPLPARGQVVWIQELPSPDNIGRKTFDAGIKFVAMEPKDRDKLNSKIKNIEKHANGEQPKA
jgi:c-di-GMP-binding flagellar brake protein YcgR